MSGLDADRGGSVETISVRRVFRVSRERAYQAWTMPGMIEQWFGPPGFTATVLEHDCRVGGQWRFRMSSEAGEVFHHTGVFVQLIPFESLSFTWTSEEDMPDWGDWKTGETLVTVRFNMVTEGTEIEITHENLASLKSREALTGGWAGSLVSLEHFLSVLEGENDT